MEENRQQSGEVTAFSEKLWCGLLDYSTAYADGPSKMAPPSRAEPGKCNAPDHRFVAGDREPFFHLVKLEFIVLQTL